MSNEEKIAIASKIKEYKKELEGIRTNDVTLDLDLKIAKEGLLNLQYAVLDGMVDSVVFDRIEIIVNNLKTKCQQL